VQEPNKGKVCGVLDLQPLGAWLDRAEWLEVKDAADLALIWLLHLGCIRSGVGPASPRMIGRT